MAVRSSVPALVSSVACAELNPAIHLIRARARRCV
jgi:hypothetical protein